MSLPDDLDQRRARCIGIVGTGRLGTSLAGALSVAGYADVLLAGRDEARTRAAASSLRVTAESIARTVERAGIVVLAVPDRAIASLAEALSWRAGQGVVHASGALGLDVLAGATGRGVLAGCLHPLQTFPGTLDRDTCAARFRGVTCGIEAPAPLDALLEAVAGDLGARTVRLEDVDRARYHAAAVLISNDVVALMASASRAWTLAGLPEASAREALAPLLLAAASNVTAMPLEQALTGPVARGDAETVRRHLEALAGDPDLLAVYRALARALLRLDLGLAPEVMRALRSLLDAADEERAAD